MKKLDRTGEIKINTQGLKMWIKEYRGAKDIDVEFQDGCIYKHRVYDEFKNGSIINKNHPSIYGVGIIGDEYECYESGLRNKPFTKWCDMMTRCYSEKLHNRNKTYEECGACDEWKYFTNFKIWYDKNYYEIEGEQMDLDKDILIKGNKIYSPETCVFVPKRINMLFVKHDKGRGDLPIGVSYDNARNKYVARCKDENTFYKFLGRYESIDEAFRSYKIFKENVIKKIANKYKNMIPYNLYSAMITYKVDITD